ncbi:MAG: HEPN domain-containing protein [Planctomycetota bacterium]|jgi:HEPN domain-containing protein/predicted nucleotidyltransferase
MKKSLSYLPKHKRSELKLIVEKIRERIEPEMIILYGSYARGDYKEQKDLAPDRKSGHVSDYDILIVTSEKKTADNTGLWHNVTKKCDKLNLSTHVRIIAHDIQFLNIQLAEGQYFFADIKKEGCMLYNSGNYKLACKRKLKPAEQKRIAQDHFNHWFKSAKEFVDTYHYELEKKRYNKAAFMLHQAVEHSYKAILLVFTEYNPNEHYLMILSHMAGKYDRELRDIFPRKTAEQEELFNLLDYAYIGARYDPDYKITKKQLEYLSKRVKILQRLTKKICKEKIESFA